MTVLKLSFNLYLLTYCLSVGNLTCRSEMFTVKKLTENTDTTGAVEADE
jgi:hypothetical protein